MPAVFLFVVTMYAVGYYLSIKKLGWFEFFSAITFLRLLFSETYRYNTFNNQN